MGSCLISMPRNKKKTILFLWLSLIAAAIIGSLTPQLAPPQQYHLDKVVHFFGYGALAFLPALLISNKRYLAMLAIALMGFGVGIELAQELVPGRDGTIGDAITNSIGVIIGIVAAIATRRRVDAAGK